MPEVKATLEHSFLYPLDRKLRDLCCEIEGSTGSRPSVACEANAIHGARKRHSWIENWKISSIEESQERRLGDCQWPWTLVTDHAMLEGCGVLTGVKQISIDVATREVYKAVETLLDGHQPSFLASRETVHLSLGYCLNLCVNRLAPLRVPHSGETASHPSEVHSSKEYHQRMSLRYPPWSAVTTNEMVPSPKAPLQKLPHHW